MGVQEVADAIDGTGAAKAIKNVELPHGVRVHSRVPRGGVSRWTKIVANVLRHAPEELQIHFCRHYFLIDSKLFFAWNLQIEWPDGTDVEATTALIAQLLRDGATAAEQPVQVVQLEKVRLNAPPDRNRPGGPHSITAPGPRTGGLSQKGAHHIGGS